MVENCLGTGPASGIPKLKICIKLISAGRLVHSVLSHCSAMTLLYLLLGGGTVSTSLPIDREGTPSTLNVNPGLHLRTTGTTIISISAGTCSNTVCTSGAQLECKGWAYLCARAASQPGVLSTEGD